MTMHLVAPMNYKVVEDTTYESKLKSIVSAANISYAAKTKANYEKFVMARIKAGHFAILEFANITVDFYVSRVISHRIVRHRHFSFMQLSNNHFVDMENKTNENLTGDTSSLLQFEQFDIPKDLLEAYNVLTEKSASLYKKLRHRGYKSFAASVLPQSLMTYLRVTGNVRTWRHFLKLRTASEANAHTRGIIVPLLEELTTLYPALFFNVEGGE